MHRGSYPRISSIYQLKDRHQSRERDYYVEGADGQNRGGRENEAPREGARRQRATDHGFENGAAKAGKNGPAGSSGVEQKFSATPGIAQGAGAPKERTAGAIAAGENGTSATGKDGTTATGVNADSPKNGISGHIGAGAYAAENPYCATASIVAACGSVK